jgi:hypothetical protein
MPFHKNKPLTKTAIVRISRSAQMIFERHAAVVTEMERLRNEE